MTWACDLSRDMAHSFHLSQFQCNLIFTKSTNSAYLASTTSALCSEIDLKVLCSMLPYD